VSLPSAKHAVGRVIDPTAEKQASNQINQLALVQFLAARISLIPQALAKHTARVTHTSGR